MNDSIEKAKSENHVISIYYDSNENEACETGYIEYVDEDDIVLLSINEFGNYDGFFVGHRHNINRIDVNGQYEKKCQFLYDLREKERRKIIDDKDFNPQIGLILYTLKSAKKLNMVCSITLDNDEGVCSIQGNIISINDKTVIFNQLTIYGEDDGFTEFYIQNIDKLCIDSEANRTISILSDKKRF